MTIKSTVKGDLIELATTDVDRYKAIAHGCNCFCTMGSGIAKTIRERFPMAYTEDCDFMKFMPKEAKLGKYSSHYSRKYDLSIFNLYTQFDFGTHKQQVIYEAVEKCFATLNRDFQPLVTNNPKQYDLGIPMIGAGLGGGDWGTIAEIINKVTPKLLIELVVFDK